MKVKTCQHTMPTGQTCGSPAMRHQSYCYFHHDRNGKLQPAPSDQDFDKIESEVTTLLQNGASSVGR